MRLHRVAACSAIALFAISALCEGNAGISSELFVQRESNGATQLFTNLNPDKTGLSVVNSYEDPRMWTERYQEMVYGTIGTGVAVADYDRDGFPDVFIAVKTGGSRLYRNRGEMRFEDVTESAGLIENDDSWSKRITNWFDSDTDEASESWDQGAVFADVNNDGWLDLFVTSFAAPNRLYINQGDGTFEEEADVRGLNLVDSSGSAAFCDYDRDGWLDVYIQTNISDALASPEGQPDRLYRNLGDGYFSDVSNQSGIAGVSAGHSATWWDYDGDLLPDLYVANDFVNPDKLYRNLGDGTFEDVLESLVPVMPYYSMGADIGDVNNDGRFDLLVGDMAPSTHEKDQRGMAVSRAREMGKGLKDVAPQVMRNALYLNTGTERFLEIASLADVARTDWTWSVRFEDLDCDGFVDLHVTNGMVREYHNADILRKIMGSMNRMGQRGIMRASPLLSESNLAFRNLGGLSFERVESSWG
ncbi:VCBS repeat-containing protein, partial [Pelagicoccus sp. SDUM812002]|uniref:FG-GAP repeat domain-containing protein n=1 Tax=Pelagicoccus sp. SDUM812002 TaxID=3041266 RepID=UPI00280DBB55